MKAGTARAAAARDRRADGGRGAAAADARADPYAWWMLVHQLPPDPPGLRMRIWRRLQDLGALQLKGSVYLLPASDTAREDLQWIVAEVRAAGAEASLWCAAAVDGLDDDALRQRFRSDAAQQYERLEAEARDLLRGSDASSPAALRSGLLRLRARLSEAVRRDHFGGAGRDRVEAALARIAARIQPPAKTLPRLPGAREPEAFRGRTWITRANVGIDRMASAWLIRRMIDPQATFEFYPAARIAAAAGKLRFDTWGGEFTHEGDHCTFEVLVERFALEAPGLVQLAEIVHDIDLKDARHGHAETAGIAASMEAIASAPIDDARRLELSATLFDGMLRQFAAGPRAGAR